MLRQGMTVALLAYEEAENLKILLPRIRENVEKLTGKDGRPIPYTIEVVDYMRPADETPEVCSQNGVSYYNQETPGFGGAFRTAIKNADREMFLIMDADGSHDPQYIPAMYDLYQSGRYDVVIGSRYIRGGRTYDSRASVAMSRVLNAVFRVAMGIKAKDISTDFRLYDTAQLKKVWLKNVNYDVLQEVLVKMKLHNPNLAIGEIPITFKKRMAGKTKRKLLKFIMSYIKTLFSLTRLRLFGEGER